MPLGQFLTTQEAAHALGVTGGRVRQFYLAGRLEAEKVGSALFFKKKSVDAFSRKPRQNGRPKES